MAILIHQSQAGGAVPDAAQVSSLYVTGMCSPEFVPLGFLLRLRKLLDA